MKDMDIAEVAKVTGIPASTLRYYEERGLIASHSRRAAMHRCSLAEPPGMHLPNEGKATLWQRVAGGIAA